MSAKHTPGPWFADSRGYIYGESIGGCRNENGIHMIAEIRGYGHLQYRSDCNEIMAANGNLIAAAPELLKALEGLCGLAEIRPGHLHEYKVAVEDARAAIAKATSAPQVLHSDSEGGNCD